MVVKEINVNKKFKKVYKKEMEEWYLKDHKNFTAIHVSKEP